MVLGDCDIEVISGGRYRLDGGSMFGIIPKPLWERMLKPDERNRIEMDTCCLLVRTSISQSVLGRESNSVNRGAACLLLIFDRHRMT